MSASRAAPTIRIGTRGSALALAQARLVAEALSGLGQPHEIVVIETEGDRRAPDTPWGEGAFVKSIERALLDGRADIAVHSAKDVPTDEDRRLAICAYLRREDPLDVLVVRADARSTGSLAELPAGSVIGTDSPRRSGFLRAHRRELEVRPLHGNVDTRLRRLDAGEVDALVLAAAGLLRLGREERISERISARIVPPAPGQGAIAVQVRADDHELLEIGRALDDRPTRQAVETERAFLRAAGGGCRAPVGGLARVLGDQLTLLGGFATPDGSVAAIDELDGALDAGQVLAAELAGRLGRERGRRLRGPRVLLTRPAEQSRRLGARLAEHGVSAVVVPTIEIRPVEAAGALDAALSELPTYDWAVVTSANGARALAEAARRVGAQLNSVRWAAVGGPTAAELQAAGVGEVWLPAVASGQALAEELPLAAGERVLLAHGSLSDELLPASLRARGADLKEVVAYVTHEAPDDSRGQLDEALAEGPFDAVVLASPSAARGLLALAGERWHVDVLALPAICIGPTTAAAARDLGFTILARAQSQETATLAELTAQALANRRAGVSA